MKEIKKDGRKLRSESTADLILNTALKIVRKGDIDISFDAIAKEAKIGTRTIFRHFIDSIAASWPGWLCWLGPVAQATQPLGPGGLG